MSELKKIEVGGRPLKCVVCRHDEFTEREALLPRPRLGKQNRDMFYLRQLRLYPLVLAGLIPNLASTQPRLLVELDNLGAEGNFSGQA